MGLNRLVSTCDSLLTSSNKLRKVMRWKKLSIQTMVPARYLVVVGSEMLNPGKFGDLCSLTCHSEVAGCP